MTPRYKQIGSMFFVMFVIVVTFSMPNASALTPEHQEILDISTKCKQDVRSNDELTFAQKAVNVKACSLEARLSAQELLVPTPSSAVQILQHQVRDCEAKYPIYEMIGKIGFLSLERSTLARHCTIMYEIDEWKIQDSSRMNALVDGLSNTLQAELDKDIQLRKDIVHKALEKYHNYIR